MYRPPVAAAELSTTASERPIPKPASAAAITTWLAPAVLLFAALALRLLGLDRKSVWFDEAITSFDAHTPWPQLLDSIRADVHPPLSYVLYHLWPAIDGGDAWLRLPSAMLGALAVIPTWLWVQRIGTRNQAALSAAFIALSALQIDLAQEARMYGLLLLLTATSLWLLDLVLTSTNPRARAAYALVATAMLYTHYYAALLLLAQAAHAALNRSRAALIALAVAALAFAPWLPILVEQASSIRSDYWIEPPTLTTLWITFRELAAHTPPLWVPRPLYVLQAGLLVLGTALAWRWPRQRSAVTLAVVPLAVAFAVSLTVAPMFAVRYISPVGLAFGFLLARGITALPRPAALVAGALAFLPVVISLGPLYTDPGFSRSDLRAAAQAVHAQGAPDEVVLHLGAFTAAPFDYYRVEPPATVLESNDRSELCQQLQQHDNGAWLVTAYAADDPVARAESESGITRTDYAADLVTEPPQRFLGVSVFHLHGRC